MSKVIDHLRRAVLASGEADLTDGQLLECFVSRRDDATAAALVRRHAPMVWGVCRRVLGNDSDAEDAFQATFLVLVRKAASIMPREMVANWLYGVAHQTALKARGTRTKRQAREKQVNEMPEPEAITEPDHWGDLQPLLDQELSRLADKYRLVIVLCDLEGKTRKDVARQLNKPEGTIASRLATARAMLAKRLARHGLAVSSGALAGLLSQNTASAGVPISVVSSTIKAASLLAAGQAAIPGVTSPKVAALTEGVLQTMLLSKLRKQLVALLLAAILVSGTGLVLSHANDPDSQKKAAVQSAEAPRKTDPGAVDATEIASEFRTNAALFDEKFLDKKVTVTGQVLRVLRRGPAWNYAIVVASGEPPVFAWFHQDDRKELATLRQWQQVTIEGVIVNVNGEPNAVNISACKIIKVGDIGALAPKTAPLPTSTSPPTTKRATPPTTKKLP
jgi:RNA polymerase sigma factor (sigma-70 family)